MHKLTMIILTLLITATATVPALAADYRFSSGADTWDLFGGETSVDTPVSPDQATENIRRNKDAAYFPPPYGVFSGDIPTGPSSLYHNNLPVSGFAAAGQDLPPIGNEDYAPGSSNVSSGLLPHTSETVALNTLPQYYEDGSIATLFVARTGKTIRVYEGEALSNLTKGAGHFSATSSWDGNVALAGHNRGGSAYFSFVKDMQSGDRLTYETKYGSRTYEVISKTEINEWDNLPLAWSAENILTLITCVAGVPELRYCVIASEVK